MTYQGESQESRCEYGEPMLCDHLLLGYFGQRRRSAIPAWLNLESRYQRANQRPWLLGCLPGEQSLWSASNFPETSKWQRNQESAHTRRAIAPRRKAAITVRRSVKVQPKHRIYSVRAGTHSARPQPPDCNSWIAIQRLSRRTGAAPAIRIQ